MALATSCPRCKTSFRVAPDQLKAHRGLVRCGSCNEVFSGVDNLRHVDEQVAGDSAAKRAPPPAVPSGVAPAPTFEHPPESFADLSWIETAQPGAAGTFEPSAAPAEFPRAYGTRHPAGATGAAPAPRRASSKPPPVADDLFASEGPSTVWNLPDTTEPLFPDTLADVPRPGERAPTGSAAPVGQTGLPASRAAAPAAQESPASAAVDSLTFLAPPRPRQPLSPGRRRAMAIASGILAVTLLVQGALAGREWLAAWMPDLTPLLSAVAAVPGLAVQAPRALDSLTLESFELQAANAEDRFSIRAILRNRARHPVRWPAMELTLTDSAGTLVARKVLMPADYLSATLPGQQGVPARSEQSIQLALQVSGLKPTGYNVKLFYP